MRSSRHSLRLFGVVFLFFASAAPAAAAEPSSPSVDQVAAESSGAAAPAPAAARPVVKERKICHVENSTGSKLGGKKTCLTARQWRARQE